ncbi:hypothetical protein SinmeB_6421 (plasmid) [Sinorhizobium meliloti BL225C]|nr:hypothetical protein SinmeB_6421 [Sinorhizobium meliloti BL225C]SDZ55512.1 hypothetical protein SAMN04244576_06441 [Sinorhizobium meliloti]
MHLFGATRVFLQEQLQGSLVVSKRELIDTGTDKAMSVAKEGKFKESDDVSRSLSADARHDAKHETKPGQGDKGDRKH